MHIAKKHNKTLLGNFIQEKDNYNHKSYHCSPIIMTKYLKIMKISNVNENAEKLDQLRTDGGNVKWYDLL